MDLIQIRNGAVRDVVTGFTQPSWLSDWTNVQSCVCNLSSTVKSTELIFAKFELSRYNNNYYYYLLIIIIIIIIVNCNFVDTWWQWSFHILHMHGLWRLIYLDLVGEGYMGSM
jgi:hypothetical protein